MLNPAGQYAHICILPQGSHLILNPVLQALHLGKENSFTTSYRILAELMKTEIAKGIETIN